MSTLMQMSGQVGIGNSGISYEAAKQLLGEDLLVNIECQSKEVDKGGEGEGGSEVSGGTTIAGGFSSMQQQQQPPFNDDLFGHQIYQGILGKYCRTTRINQQLADVLPNYEAAHGLGLIEYDYQFHYQYNTTYCQEQQQQQEQEQQQLFSDERNNSVDNHAFEDIDIHAFQDSSNENYDDYDYDSFTPQEEGWALIEKKVDDFSGSQRIFEGNEFSGIQRNFESNNGSGNFSGVSSRQNFEDGSNNLCAPVQEKIVEDKIEVDKFYAKKIAASFLSMDHRTPTMPPSSATIGTSRGFGHENVMGFSNQDWMMSFSNYNVPTVNNICQPANVIDDLQHPARVIRGGPYKSVPGQQKPLIVRVSTSNSPTLSQQKAASNAIFSAFTLSSLHHQLNTPNTNNKNGADSDARNSLKHIPPKQILAQNLEESMRQRYFRNRLNNSIKKMSGDRCQIRVNQTNQTAALAAITDPAFSSKNHRGSKGPRPDYSAVMLKGLNIFDNQYSFNQDNNNINNNKNKYNNKVNNGITFNDKLNNELDLDNQERRNRSSKHSKTRRNRNRKQQQYYQQQQQQQQLT